MALSLAFKKKLHNIADRMTGMAAILGSLAMSVVLMGVFTFRQVRANLPLPGDAQKDAEEKTLAQDVKNLSLLHKYEQSYRLQADGAEAIPTAALPPGMDVTALKKQADKLDEAFQAAADKTVVDIMHARYVPDTRLEAFVDHYRAETDTQPDNLINLAAFGTRSLRACQNSVMSQPGFAPDAASARKIEACIEDKGMRDLDIKAEALGGIFAFFGGAFLLRMGLKRYIDRDEAKAAAAPPPPPPTPPAPPVMPVAVGAAITIKKPLRLARRAQP